MPHEVIMPALGMAQDTGIIVSWRKALGDTVAIGDPLFDVETDKTTMEVEAAHAGFLTEIRAVAGTEVPIGETIAIIAGAPDEVPAGASGDARPDLAPGIPKEPIAPTVPNPSKPPTVRNKPAAPSTPSAVPILASPKARFEAYRRGIDLRQLVDQGVLQPFHVADLDRLKPETGMVGALPQVSVLTASFAGSAFNGFIAWAEERTGRQTMRQAALAAFAAGAFRKEVRSYKADGLMVSLVSAKAGALEITLRDPDLQGLGDLDGAALKSGDTVPDLQLIDLSGTRLVDYQPPIQPGLLSIVIADSGSGEASVNLHFCEDDLPFIVAARFLDNFATRIAEPVLQLM